MSGGKPHAPPLVSFNLKPNSRLGLLHIPSGSMVWEEGLQMSGSHRTVMEEVLVQYVSPKTYWTVTLWFLQFSQPGFTFLAAGEFLTMVHRPVVFKLLVLAVLQSKWSWRVPISKTLIRCLGPNGAAGLEPCSWDWRSLVGGRKWGKRRERAETCWRMG